MTEPKSPLSLLESLPAELLQEIFLHCLEFNLPRASAHIAALLSNPTIYTWLIRLAFSSDNESSDRAFFTADGFLPAPLEYGALDAAERTKLQNDILNSRWCTLQLMRKCQREYLLHVIGQQCRHLVFAPGDEDTLLRSLDEYFRSSSTEEECAILSQSHPYDIDTGDWRGTKGDLNLKVSSTSNTTNTNSQHFTLSLWLHPGALLLRPHPTTTPVSISTSHDVFRLPSSPTDPPPRIPDRLLRGPWNAPKLDFLSLLAQDAYIDEDASHDRSRRVLRGVIRSRELDVFTRLLGMKIRTRQYKYSVRWPVQGNHFWVALKYADEGVDAFVRVLVERRWEDVPGDDLRLKGELMGKMGWN